MSERPERQKVKKGVSIPKNTKYIISSKNCEIKIMRYLAEILCIIHAHFAVIAAQFKRLRTACLQ